MYMSTVHKPTISPVIIITALFVSRWRVRQQATNISNRFQQARQRSPITTSFLSLKSSQIWQSFSSVLLPDIKMFVTIIKNVSLFFPCSLKFFFFTELCLIDLIGLHSHSNIVWLPCH